MHRPTKTIIPVAELTTKIQSTWLSLAVIHQSLHIAWREIQREIGVLLTNDWVDDFGYDLAGVVDWMVDSTSPDWLSWGFWTWFSLPSDEPKDYEVALAAMHKVEMNVVRFRDLPVGSLYRCHLGRSCTKINATQAKALATPKPYTVDLRQLCTPIQWSRK